MITQREAALRRIFSGEWVTSASNGNFCVMSPKTTIHTNGKIIAQNPNRIADTVQTFMLAGRL